ncbi:MULTISPECIES: hypothetical protein [unclassified Halomonas]|uniref:hypothetical protein n=1 Tax=unclassified Halomonas TaxID=2609666 RepID=UPI002468836D|nr:MULTISPECIES: hypothetical protein [unclassified Halomonas]
MKVKTSPECPKCGSREKRFPPGREDQYHVYCDGCGHDFGRFDHFQSQFRHLLDDLETQLKREEATDDDAT